MRQTRLLAPMSGVQVRDAGAGDGSYTIKGKASVFNQWSLPLGAQRFYEQIAPKAFERALEGDPHVVALWDHDTRFLLGSTENRTLTVSEEPDGLGYWTRVAPTSYAQDLRVLIERGDISQCSFAFTIEQERAAYVNEGKPDERIEFTVEEVGDLLDVTVCAMGAYPQTAVSMNNLAGRRDRLENALREGRVEGLTLDGALERGLIMEDPDATPVPNRAAEVNPTDKDRSEVVDEQAAWLAQARAAHQSAELLTASRAV